MSVYITISRTILTKNQQSLVGAQSWPKHPWALPKNACLKAKGITDNWFFYTFCINMQTYEGSGGAATQAQL